MQFEFTWKLFGLFQELFELFRELFELFRKLFESFWELFRLFWECSGIETLSIAQRMRRLILTHAALYFFRWREGALIGCCARRARMKT